MNADATESHGEACGFVASHHDITLCLLLAVAVFMMVAMVSADADADSETFVVDDVHYKISEEEVHVIGIEPVPLYNLIIPESVTYLDKEYKVTVIENGAFYNSSNLTGFLSLPSSLEYVYSNAIYGCNNISSLKINAGLLCEGSISNCTGLKIITVGKNTTFNTGAFNNCTSVFSLEYDSSFDSNFKIMPFCNMGVTDLEITFGDNVISLTSKLFSGIINVKITDNYIGPNIEKIYENAFYGCKFINGFNEIIIGKNVSNISLKAFDDELNLKAFSVEVGNEYYCAEDGLLYSGVTTDYKLIRVPNLKEGLIGLKSGTVSISDHSFNQCDSIHSLYVPSTLETLSIDTIRNISSLESISVSSDNNVYCSIDGILCNKETKNALLYPISKLDVVYELPSSLKGLESKSIVDCAYLNKLVIGSNITYLGYESIFNCANLLEVVYDVPIIFKSFIGESGTTCGYTITFGNNSGAITPYFLQNDLNLSSINFMNSTPIVLPNSFVGCSNLKQINFNDVVESINSVSFEGCNTIEEISVPITLIASLSGCFSDVSLLNTLIISAGATGICPDISSIEKIWSAEKTTNNINLTIQDGVKTIDASLLSCCSNIAGSLILPTSIISIDEGSFKDTFLSSITFNGDSDAYSIVDGCLLSKDESILYWCPKNKESITLSQNTVRFGNYALFGCSNLNSIFTCASEIEYGVGSLDSNISALCTFYCFSVPSESSTFGKTSQNYYEYIVPLTIRYILSGGTMSSPELLFQVPSSNLTIILETPIRTEYTFVSWEDSNGHRYDSGDVVSVEEDAITFTAIWAKTNYVVFFNPNGGIGDSFSSDYTYGVQKEFPVVDYVMDRQDLLNWNTEKDGSGDSYPLDYSESMIEVCDSDSVILYAIWTDYPSIFFVTDGGTLIETITGAEGTEINDPAPPIKTGYSFAGWNPEVPDVMPAEDLICEAVWNINVYSITYQFNNGQPNLVRTYEYNSEVEVESNPSRVGYTFSNWSSEIPLVMPAYDLEITATWVANQYYVKFVGNGSTEGVMDDQIMIYDNYHSLLPVVFERTGYYFSGWAESDTGVSVYGDCQTVINLTSGDSGEEYVVLYATWEPVEYRVVFHNNGGSGDMWAIYVTYDSSDKLSDCTFTKLGHSFSGWSLSPTGDVIRLDGAVANNLSCGAEVNLYAIWSINQYTITFDTKGGPTINNITQDYGSQIVKPGNPTREGYTFIGWSETIPDTMPAESLTIDAIWSINSYSITYILNNGSEQVIKTYEYGTEIDDVPVPLKTGYHFVSWSPNVPGTMPAHNLEVECVWSPNVHRVDFIANGGEGSMDSIELTYDTSYGLPECTFTREGHTFLGWSYSSNGNVVHTDGKTVKNLDTGTDPLELFAIWSINSYSITYILNNGSDPQTVSYVYGSEISPLPEVSKTGYHFVSWSPNVPGTMPAHNLEVECVWSPNVHRVDFIANGGEGSMDSIELTYDTSYDLPKCIFIKEGHTFLGWSYSSNGNVVHTDGKTVKNLDTGTDPLELFAIWSINSYSITYVLNNGSEQVIKTYEYSSEIDDVPAPSKTGYHFVSWSPEIPDTMPASDLTTECIWSPNVHRVDFIANGGDGFMESIELTYDVSYDLPKCIFIKEGHTFQGWALSHDGIVVHTDGKTIKNLDTGTDPLELYAIWSINSYSITYILNNGSDPIIDIHVYGTEIDDVPAPSKTGYHFVSWSPEIPDTMPASDLTTECIWSPNVCELSFDPNGGSEEMDSIDITYDEQTTLPLCLFVKVGYSFIGWSYSADGAVVYEDGKVLINPTACTDPLILFAKWSPNSYKVTFTPNGGVGSDIDVTYTYDSDVILPKNTFTRTGHTFDGWSLTSGGPLVRGDMSAVDNLSTGDDIVLYAKWSVNSYSLTFLDTGDSVVNTIVADYGTSIICPEDPVKEGHTFLRWDPAIPVTMPAEGSSHTAIWERNTYVLTFAFDNGESNRVYEYEFAASIALTFNLLRTGYTFTGWDVPIPNTMPSRDMTITAQWSPNAYGIGYEPNGGSGVMSDSSAIYDSDIGLKQCTFERIGHTFMGWATAVSGQVRFSDGQQVSNLATGTTGDDRCVLYAIWSPNEYMVTFHSSIDNGTVTHTYTYGVDSSLPTGLFNREGHSISGWALAPDGEMVRSEGGDVNNLSTGDSVDLYALWALNRYVISFHNTGDSSIRSISGLYGSDVESPEDPVRKGYTFQGWVPKVPDRMPAKDAQINATWSINNYVIGFRDCDLDDITVEYGRILELPSPERTGYIFGGWKEGAPQAMPDSNIVLTASWVPRTMTVSFHGFEELGLTVEYDSPYGELPDAERQGYDLRGWFSDEGLTQRVTEQSVVNNCADHVLYGHFVKVWVISISTESDGRGQVFGSGTYDHGTYVSVGATPVDGYAFVRWSDGGRMAERTLVADSDISIDAVFSPLRMVMLDDGSEIDRRNVPVGEPLILPDSGCARPGYEFMGWTDGVQRYRVGSEIPMPSEDVSLEGVWRPILYTITFDDGGDKTTFRLHAGAAIPDVTVDDTVDLVFSGWDSVVPGTMPAHDLYLRSVWAAREVSYVFHDSDMQVLRLEVGSDMPEPPVPSREGHVFEGWDPIVPDVVGAEDMTFVARWSVGTFSINYIPLNDSQMSVVNVRYGEPIPVISEPIRKGYRFTGWSPQIPELMPAEDITVRANWEAIEYKVVLDKSDGEVVIKGTYGSPVPVPHGVEVRDGYEFGGWDSDIPSTFPDHDLVISGTWVPKTFVLTLDLEEDIVMDVSCGSSIPDVQVPSKEGYRFIGWVPGIEAMPAHDVTLVPEWSVETYVVTFDMCDGNSPQNVSIPYGSEIPLPESSDGPIVCWSPTVPDRMPAHNMTFRAVFSAPCHDDGGIREFVGDGCTVVANIDGHISGTLRIVSEDHWSMLLSTDSLDDVRGPVFATVRSTGEYGGYEVDVRTERGEIRGNVVVNIPYLGHVGDRARVSIVDMSGQHTSEAVCMEYNGRTYLSVEASPNSLCQIVEVLGDADEGFDYLYLSIPVVVTLAVLALILWRRLGQ